MDVGLLVLRVVVGLLLVGHGTRKLFAWFGGGGLAGTAWYFRSVGYRRPRLMARLAGSVEVVAGGAIALGFLTPLGAAAVIGTMLNAAVAVHRRNGLWAVDNGYEYPLMIAAAAATLAFTGAGAASVDAHLGVGDPSVESGLLAVALGLAAGAVVLVSRATAQARAGLLSVPRRARKLAA
ncbi:MAG TPA: DoxX family protein [Acidimicrobiia bacterium]|nr:DoxX family protein [Acidimicrobiia bacterium]